MSGPLDGVRVLEIASWMFMPSAGTVLVDWGADVIKVENPETGDPQRGLITSGLVPGGAGGFNFMMEQPNRGKRSVAINLAHDDGREAFLKLVEQADVVITNYLPPVLRKLRLEIDDLRARNPKIIICRGSGQGPKGPDAERPAYDAAAFWARSGLGMTFPPSEGWPPGQPTPAFGDVVGGLSAAGAVAAALVKLARTGEPSVVDVSLLSTGMWQIAPMVIASKLYGFDRITSSGRGMSPNPGVGTYKTGDDRFIMLMLLQSDKHWAELVGLLGRPDMATDERFCDSGARAQNHAECIAQLDAAFASKTLDEWKAIFEDFSGAWAPFQTLGELYTDPQVEANGYLPKVQAANGDEVSLVASPAQFDEEAISVERCPEHGEHTELVLIEAGYDWDKLSDLKESGAIL
jgi:crotonobetainyl-CoA:carnitine CoA-transferase CaiB-like acyl-CoA transferase